MTVASTTRRNDAVGNGSTSNYPYTFRILDEADILVSVENTSGTITTLVLTTDYTVNGVGSYSGGSIDLVDAGQAWLTSGNLITDYKITIRRRLTLTQLTDLRNRGGFYPEDHETVFDRDTMIDLQQQDELDRSLKFPETDSSALSPELPPSSQRASKYLAFDASGNAIASGGGAGSVPISAFMETVVGAADADAALSTLAASASTPTADAATLRSVLGLGTAAVIADNTLVHLTETEDVSLSGLLIRAAKNVGPDFIQNFGIAAAVAANALTVSLKGANGSDPSATNQVAVAFRSTTAASGTYNLRTIAAALSVTLPQDGTLGFASLEKGYVYVYLCDDGTDRRIGLAHRALFDEGSLHTTTAIGTGSDDADILYTSAIMTGASIRLIGRITITTGATPGDWGASPTLLELWTPNMKKTGDVLNRVSTHTGALVTGSNTIANDDNIPQITEGFEVMTCTVNPRKDTSTFKVDVVANHSDNATSDMVCTALFRDAVADALGAVRNNSEGVHAHTQGVLSKEVTTNSTSQIVFRVRLGGLGALIAFNGSTTIPARSLGGAMASSITVTEYEK